MKFKLFLLGFLIVFVGIMATNIYLSIPRTYMDLNYFITEYKLNKFDRTKNGAEQADYEQELKNIFIGKYVYYTGKIDVIYRHKNEYVIRMQPYNTTTYNNVSCYLDVDDWKEEVYKLKRGQTIEIRGKFNRFFIGISIKNCELIDIED